MNTLFIIGNGFDLAHGMKTSYSDFLFWYFKRSIDKLTIYDNIFKDHFFNLNRLKGSGLFNIAMKDLQNIDDMLNSEDIRHKYTERRDSRNGDVGNSKAVLEIEFLSSFFENLLSYSNWKDLESAYFSKLCEIHKKFVVHNSKALEDIASHSKSNKFNEIKVEKLLKPVNKLNKDWDILKSSLKEYLIEIDASFNHENQCCPVVIRRESIG